MTLHALILSLPIINVALSVILIVTATISGRRWLKQFQILAAERRSILADRLDFANNALRFAIMCDGAGMKTFDDRDNALDRLRYLREHPEASLSWSEEEEAFRLGGTAADEETLFLLARP